MPLSSHGFDAIPTSIVQHHRGRGPVWVKGGAVARRQQARLWELRATAALARHWDKNGNTAAARDLLAPVYGWFSEGLDAPDLRRARSLLKRLD